MPKLPSVTGKELLRRLLAVDCEVVRVKGSHYRLRNRRNGRFTTLPVHGGALKIGTLYAVLRDLGIDAQEFFGV